MSNETATTTPSTKTPDPREIMGEKLFQRLVSAISDQVATKLFNKLSNAVVVPDDHSSDLVSTSDIEVPEVEEEHTVSGRNPKINDKDFLAVLKKANSIEEVINAIPELKAMSHDRARQYVVSRKAYLKRTLGPNKIKDFPRGRLAHKAA